MFYTRWSDHLGISTHTNSQNSHPFVSHIICGVIIWKSQSIQTLKTRTLVHNTSLLSRRHQMKLFFFPESKRVYRDFLSVDSYNYEPAKTEWSQSWWDVFFLAYISAWCPHPPYAITTRVKKSMADTTCHTRNRCVITIHHAAGKSNFQQNLRQQGSCTTNRAFCQNIYCLLESTQVLEHTHDCNGITPHQYGIITRDTTHILII